MADRVQDLIHIQNCLKNFLREHPTTEQEKQMVEEIMQKILELKAKE